MLDVTNAKALTIAIPEKVRLSINSGLEILGASCQEVREIPARSELADNQFAILGLTNDNSYTLCSSIVLRTNPALINFFTHWCTTRGSISETDLEKILLLPSSLSVQTKSISTNSYENLLPPFWKARAHIFTEQLSTAIRSGLGILGARALEASNIRRDTIADHQIIITDYPSSTGTSYSSFSCNLLRTNPALIKFFLHWCSIRGSTKEEALLENLLLSERVKALIANTHRNGDASLEKLQSPTATIVLGKPGDSSLIFPSLDKFFEHIESINLTKSIRLLNEAVQKYPNHPRIGAACAKYRMRIKDFNGAQEILTDFLRRHPSDASLLYHLADLKYQLSKFTEAHELATKALKNAGSASRISRIENLRRHARLQEDGDIPFFALHNAEMSRLFREIYNERATKDFANLITSIKKILDYHSHYQPAHLLLARTYLKQCSLEDAESSLRQAWLLDFGDETTAYLYAQLHHYQAKFKEAFEILRLSLKANPHSITLWKLSCEVAQFLLDDKKFYDQIAAFYKQHPQDIFAIYYAGCAYAFHGNLENAKLLFNRAYTEEYTGLRVPNFMSLIQFEGEVALYQTNARLGEILICALERRYRAILRKTEEWRKEAPLSEWPMLVRWIVLTKLRDLESADKLLKPLGLSENVPYNILFRIASEKRFHTHFDKILALFFISNIIEDSGTLAEQVLSIKLQSEDISSPDPELGNRSWGSKFRRLMLDEVIRKKISARIAAGDYARWTSIRLEEE